MASQIASLKNAAGVEKGFPTLEETIPSESKGCEAPVLFRVPCNIPAHPCGYLFFRLKPKTRCMNFEKSVKFVA